MAWILDIARESRPTIADGATEYPAGDIGARHPDAPGSVADCIRPALRSQHPYASPVGAGSSRARRPGADLPYRYRSHSWRRRECAGDHLMYVVCYSKAPGAPLALFLFARAPMPFFAQAASPNSRSWLRGRSVIRYEPATGAGRDGARRARKAGSSLTTSRTESPWAQPRSISSRRCLATFSTISCGKTSRHGTGDPR